MYLFMCKAVPGSGVWFWWSGKDPISAEKRACQAPTRPAGQQPSQASCPLLLYPNTQRLFEKSRDDPVCFSKLSFLFHFFENYYLNAGNGCMFFLTFL